MSIILLCAGALQYFSWKKDFKGGERFCFLFKTDDESSVNGKNNVDITTPTEKQYLIEVMGNLFRAMEYMYWSISW